MIVYKVELKFTFTQLFLYLQSLYAAYGKETLCDVFIDVFYCLILCRWLKIG